MLFITFLYDNPIKSYLLLTAQFAHFQLKLKQVTHYTVYTVQYTHNRLMIVSHHSVYIEVL